MGIRVNGPYAHGKNGVHRLHFTIGDKQRVVSFPTKALALKGLDEALRKLNSITIDEAIAEWLASQESRVSAGTLTTNRFRLRGILRYRENGHRALASVQAAEAQKLYARRAAEVAPDTHHAELELVTRMWEWAEFEGYIKGAKANVWAEVEPIDSRNTTVKPQPRVDESRKLVRAALAEGTPEGLAVLLAVFLGLRASEVVSRTVRDLDDGGTLLWIPCSKTPSGVRQMEIPECLRAPLILLTQGKQPHDPLLGLNSRGRALDRHWLHHHVERLCRKARIPVVTPHALRRLHATLAVVNSVSVDVVAAALGHKNSRTTRQHYIHPEAESGVRAKKVQERLQR